MRILRYMAVEWDMSDETARVPWLTGSGRQPRVLCYKGSLFDCNLPRDSPWADNPIRSVA